MRSSYVNGKQTVLIKQRLQVNVRTAVLLFAVTIATALLFASHSFAATANTLKVTPVRSDIQVTQGTAKTVKVVVTNLTNAPISVHPIENDFIAGDERGTPALILDENQYAPTHSLKRFMTPLQDITIPAKKSSVVNVVITVPKTAQAGGYFGAVRFAPTTPASGGQVNLSASVASLILLTVPGPAVEKLDMTNFDILQNGHTAAFFRTPDNIQVEARFQNQGNLQEGPFGHLSVTQGKKVVYQTDFNTADPRQMVLPDSARRWDIPLKNLGTFGHYTVSATFTYGTKNQTIDVTKSFWVVPMQVIIGALIALLVLIALIIGIVFFLRGYKRRILKQHGGLGSGYRR